MNPARISVPELLDAFRPGATIYLQGATGEVRALQQALAAEPDRLSGVTLVSCLVPGMNAFDYGALHPNVRVRVFMMSPAMRGSFDQGRTEIVPLPYSGVAEHLAALDADLAILNLAPPVDGRCSFGACADFGPIVGARRKVGALNPGLPRTLQAPGVIAADLDAVIEIDETPSAGAPTKVNRELATIAKRVADLIPDKAAIQSGIGGAPEAAWSALAGKRGLRLRSGMVTDGFLAALDAGAMTPDGHVAGVAYGSEALYARLHGSDLVRFADVRETHGARALMGVERLHAINSALEVDLFGQANLEWREGRLISGVGGSPDFARAARLSPGGRFILALPATAANGAVSRIVPQLRAPSVSLSRDLADVVVTEHGVACLRELTLDARAEALIAIAAPDHRDALANAWAELRRAL